MSREGWKSVHAQRTGYRMGGDQVTFPYAVDSSNDTYPVKCTEGHQHAILVDPDNSYAPWGTSNPIPVSFSAGTLATEATLSSLNSKVTICNTGAVVVSGSALPTGAATEATLSAVSGKLPASLGPKSQGNSLSVTQSTGSTWDVADSNSQSSLSSIDGKITACNTGAVVVSSVPVAGVEANASDAVTTSGSDENSTSVDCQYGSNVSVTGHVSQACVIKVFQSQNNSTWYDSGVSFTAAGDQDFYMFLQSGLRYVRLQYSASGTTVTATIASKP